MIRRPVLISFAACVLTLTIAAPRLPAQTTGEVEWYPTLESASKRASETGRQAAAVFYTTWCRWCRMLEDSTLSNPALIELGKRLVFARINAEQDTVVAHDYRVHTYPTTIVVTPEGAEVDRVIGFEPPQRYAELISDILDGKDTFWDLDRKIKRDGETPELLFKLGGKHKDRGEFDFAREKYKKILTTDKDNESGYTDDAMFALARMDREEGRWYKAVVKLRDMLEKFPGTDLRQQAMGYIPWLYEQAGDTLQAVTAYREFTKVAKVSEDRDWAERRLNALAGGE